MNPRKYATIQVDLDGLWTNLAYYGYDHPVEDDPVFASSVPRFIELFKEFDVKATFFLIGRDGEVPWKAELVKKLVEAGHEVANHTYNHPFGLRKLPQQEQVTEIERGEEVIKKITGKKPRGFKAPGYDMDAGVLRLLAEKGYRYDSSMIPTFVYPMIMKMMQLISGGAKRTHGPKWSWAFAPNTVYRPSGHKESRRGKMPLVELPCTVVPGLRLPYHATFALRLGMPYFSPAYGLTKMTRGTLNYEFHAVDLADDITDDRLTHVKGIPLSKRIERCRAIVKKMVTHYDVVVSEDLVQEVQQGNGLLSTRKR